MTLPDGSRLSWHEFGDPDGSPVIYTAGMPVSGLGGGSYDEAARAAGLRWVSPDKPGYGGSDDQRQRSLIGWGDDLAALAGHLGLDRFALAARHSGVRIEFEVVADALRPGTRGAVQELDLIKRPWPFPLSEVKTPVHLWHGALDRNAPIAIAPPRARAAGRYPARQRLAGARCRPPPQRRDHVRDRLLRDSSTGITR